MENVIPDIFKSPLVNISWDAFWEQLPEDMAQLIPKDTLVLSLPFVQGSQEEVQLVKMLAACKLSTEHYNVVQMTEGQKIAWHLLRDLTKPTKVLLLGIHPEQLGIAALFVQHEINNFDNVKWTPTLPLTLLQANNPLKQHLWTNVFQQLYL
jgi:hypothetical protein